MKDLISDQIEWLISNPAVSSKMTRQLVTLIGFLAGDKIPPEIDRQAATLSRLSILQENFDALVQMFNGSCRPQIAGIFTSKKKDSGDSSDTSDDSWKNSLIAQIELARKEISSCEPVNYSQVIAWVFAQAKNQKMLRASGRR